jgi:hypothetical protein
MAVVETVIAVVGAVRGGVEAAQVAIDWAARSCVIEIDNMTAETLELTSQGHSSGGFAQSPPLRIGPWDHALITSHTTDIGQGAVGNLGFSGRDMGLLIDFGNPVVGENHLHASVVGSRAGEFELYTSAGPGNKGALFRCALSIPHQDNWRFCAKCHGVFFNGPDQQNHRCPAGDFHHALGHEFVVPHDVPDGPRLQRGWGFCTKCHGMFWTGPDQQNHRCPAGDLHNALGHVFALPHDLPETRALQANWRFCGKCHGMFWNGPDAQNHRCPAGELHNAMGWQYVLPHKP